jgi:hypothetical protein
MEAINKTLKSKTNTLLILLIVIPVIITVTCLTLNISPFQLEWLIIDFAVHHYFIFGFISLILFLSIKFYFFESNEPKKNRNFSEMLKKVYYRNLRRKRRYSTYNNHKNEETKIVIVDKKNIGFLNYSNQDVLLSNDEKKMRENELKKSMTLGNQYKQKVKIFFKDDHKTMLVETTVWSADPNYISLKGGVVIPVRSIYKVIL